MSDSSDFSVLTALAVPVIVLAEDQRIVAANPQAQALFGADITGWHYVTALRQPDLLSAVEKALQERHAKQVAYHRQTDGQDTIWGVQVEPFADSMVVLTFQDISALEDAANQRRDFVANVSHELRTPLTSLRGFIETLRGPARDDAAARDRFLGIMDQEAGRMHRLVEDLLSLSRVEDQERVRPREPVKMTDLLEDLCQSLGPISKDRGVSFEIDAPETIPLIPGDPDQLRQVFQNLMENAVKYGAVDCPVSLRIAPPGFDAALREEALRISVCNQGDAIAPHHIARLTERFFRVDSHRSREVGGTGLGLAIVKHIIARHRGRLRIESPPGEGACFHVILPLRIT